jgi:hypothetical protein
MESHRTKNFRTLYKQLPDEIRRQAREAYRLFKNDPYHPSLQFKRVSRKQSIYSVRIGLSYRALGIREDDDVIVWFWIGSHADYDRLLAR